jgi:recombination protein RecA
MIYGEGISRESEIIDIATGLDIIKKSGSWFSYEGERIGQGKESVKRYFKDNPAAAAEVEAKIRANTDKVKIATGNNTDLDGLIIDDDIDPDDLGLDITADDFK